MKKELDKISKFFVQTPLKKQMKVFRKAAEGSNKMQQQIYDEARITDNL
jgi:hypothetical protein